jgi:hypothetical protein
LHRAAARRRRLLPQQSGEPHGQTAEKQVRFQKTAEGDPAAQNEAPEDIALPAGQGHRRVAGERRNGPYRRLSSAGPRESTMQPELLLNAYIAVDDAQREFIAKISKAYEDLKRDSKQLADANARMMRDIEQFKAKRDRSKN